MLSTRTTPITQQSIQQQQQQYQQRQEQKVRQPKQRRRLHSRRRKRRQRKVRPSPEEIIFVLTHKNGISKESNNNSSKWARNDIELLENANNIGLAVSLRNMTLKLNTSYNDSYGRRNHSNSIGYNNHTNYNINNSSNSSNDKYFNRTNTSSLNQLAIKNSTLVLSNSNFKRGIVRHVDSPSSLQVLKDAKHDSYSIASNKFLKFLKMNNSQLKKPSTINNNNNMQNVTNNSNKYNIDYDDKSENELEIIMKME